jgi:hypothetical protein
MLNKLAMEVLEIDLLPLMEVSQSSCETAGERDSTIAFMMLKLYSPLLGEKSKSNILL